MFFLQALPKMFAWGQNFLNLFSFHFEIILDIRKVAK